MPTIRSGDADIHFEIHGPTTGATGSTVLLIAGLGGVGASWGPQIELFSKNRRVIVPDHRGTGRSTHTKSGQTIAQHALDFAHLVEHVGCGPVHCVGSSTGGAITQVLALEHPAIVGSATIASSWAKADPFFERQFAARARMMAAAGVRAANELAALFLFDPRFQAARPDLVEGWVEMASGGGAPVEIGLTRIDMIRAHDRLAELGRIRRPTLVIVGQSDFCTPPHLSEQIAAAIPGAELARLPGGHFFYAEHPIAFHDRVEAFIAVHDH